MSPALAGGFLITGPPGEKVHFPVGEYLDCFHFFLFMKRVSVSVWLDCHNKILQTGWLKSQKLIFSQFWRL